MNARCPCSLLSWFTTWSFRTSWFLFLSPFCAGRAEGSCRVCQFCLTISSLAAGRSAEASFSSEPVYSSSNCMCVCVCVCVCGYISRRMSFWPTSRMHLQVAFGRWEEHSFNGNQLYDSWILHLLFSRKLIFWNAPQRTSFLSSFCEIDTAKRKKKKVVWSNTWKLFVFKLHVLAGLHHLFSDISGSHCNSCINSLLLD